MLKELLCRLNNLNPKSTTVPVESHDSYDESTDQVELYVGSEERIGNSDLDEPNEEREEDCPKEIFRGHLETVHPGHVRTV